MAAWLVVVATGGAMGLRTPRDLPRVPRLDTSVPTVEIFGEREISQTLWMPASGFNAVDLSFSPAGDRLEGRVVLSMFAAGTDGEERLWYRTSVEGGEVVATPSYRFRFPPIEDSRGRMYRVRVEVPQARPGEGVVLWSTDGRWTNGGSLFTGQQSGFAELVLTTRIERPRLAARVWHRYRRRADGLDVAALLLMALAGAVAFTVVCRAVIARGAPTR